MSDDLELYKTVFSNQDETNKKLMCLYKDIRTLAKIQKQILNGDLLLHTAYTNKLDDILKRTEFLEENK